MDTLEGLSNLPDMLAEVCRSMLDDQAMVSALRGRIGDMQERCGRIEARARKKRELVCSVMERADLKKVTEPDLTSPCARPGRPWRWSMRTWCRRPSGSPSRPSSIARPDRGALCRP